MIYRAKWIDIVYRYRTYETRNFMYSVWLKEMLYNVSPFFSFIGVCTTISSLLLFHGVICLEVLENATETEAENDDESAGGHIN